MYRLRAGPFGPVRFQSKVRQRSFEVLARLGELDNDSDCRMQRHARKWTEYIFRPKPLVQSQHRLECAQANSTLKKQPRASDLTLEIEATRRQKERSASAIFVLSLRRKTAQAEYESGGYGTEASTPKAS